MQRYTNKDGTGRSPSYGEWSMEVLSTMIFGFMIGVGYRIAEDQRRGVPLPDPRDRQAVMRYMTRLFGDDKGAEGKTGGSGGG